MKKETLKQFLKRQNEGHREFHKGTRQFMTRQSALLAKMMQRDRQTLGSHPLENDPVFQGAQEIVKGAKKVVEATGKYIDFLE